MPARRLLSLLFCTALFSLLQNTTLAQSSLPSSAQPRSLAAGDFHGDGTIDLVSGFADGSAGFIVLHRANLDVQKPSGRIGDFPASRSAKGGTPFRAEGDASSVPVSPDFLGAGNFNNDGRLDLVLAARGGNAIYLLPGDGRGGFGAVVRMALPGAVTALVTGEVNRADGLADFVVGVNGTNGPQVMVFESPLGAWRAQPEVFAVPGEPTGLALGRFHGNYINDLAVATGSQVVFIEGRDRMLTQEPAVQARVLPARVSRLSFPISVASLAKGDFTNTGKEQLAVLLEDGSIHVAGRLAEARNTDSAKSALWEDRLLVSGTGSRAKQMVTGRISGRGGDDLILLDSWSRQIHIQPGGGTSARVSHNLQAEPVTALVVRTGARAKSQLVVLLAGHTAPSQLTSASDPIFTVTNTSDAGLGSLRQALLNAEGASGDVTINFNIPGTGPFTIQTQSALPTITVPNTVIDGSSQPGFTGAPIVGIDGGGFSFSGLTVDASNITIAHLDVTGFGTGIDLTPPTAGSALIKNNYLGVGFDGVTKKGNQSAIVIESPSNIITGNLISGNTVLGVDISGASATGNLIAGNSVGISINGGNSGNFDYGVVIGNGASNNTIGGTTAPAGNTISGNGIYGVFIAGNTTTGNLIQGNFIGTDATGKLALGNSSAGLHFEGAPNNTAGGTATGARNVISGNGTNGVEINGPGSTNNLLQANFVGVDVTGMASLGNSADGVNLFNSASNNFIGGAAAGAGNVISANGGAGITFGQNTFSNNATENEIGVFYTYDPVCGCVSTVGNKGNGIATVQATDIVVARNFVAFNGLSGGLIDTGTAGVTWTDNRDIINGGLPLDLSGCAVPDNCGTTSAGNLGLNSFLLTSASISGSNLTILGTLKNPPNATYKGEFFFGPSSSSAGQNIIGSTVLSLGASGTSSFNVTLPLTVIIPGASFLTGTVTDASGNTSEYAIAAQILSSSAGVSITGVTSMPNPSVEGQPVTITVRTFGEFSTVTPTGTVSVTLDGNLIASGALDSFGEFNCGFPPPTVAGGTHTLTASYSGDSMYTPSSGTSTVQVNPAPTSLTVGSSVNPSVFGQAVVLTSTLSVKSPGSGNPTGTVNFFDGTALIGSVDFSTGPIPFFSLPLGTRAGIHIITATYSGDRSFQTSSTTFTHQVNQAGTKLVVNFSAAPAVFGQPINLMAPVTAMAPGSGTPTGTVTFFDGTAALGTGPLNGSGIAALSGLTFTVGSHTISAKFSGDFNFLSVISPEALEEVNLANTILMVDCPASATVNVPFTCPIIATAVAPSTAIVSGTVQFSLDGGPLSTRPIASGHSTISITLPSTGPHILNVSSLANLDFNASTAAPVTITGTAAGPILLTPSDVSITASGLLYSRVTQTFNGTVTIKNVRANGMAIAVPVQLVVTALPSGVTLANATGTFNGNSFITFPSVTSLASGQSATVGVQFKNEFPSTKITFTPLVYSGTF